MIVLYTNSFADHMNKYRGKEKVDLEDFFDRVQQRIISDPLYLCRPYMKIKLSFKNRAIRFAFRFDEEKGVILPLFITDKNDKQHGFNMSRDPSFQTIIKHCMNLADEDLSQDEVRVINIS